MEQGCQVVRKVPDLLTEAGEGPHFGNAGWLRDLTIDLEQIRVMLKSTLTDDVAHEQYGRLSKHNFLDVDSNLMIRCEVK